MEPPAEEFFVVYQGLRVLCFFVSDDWQALQPADFHPFFVFPVGIDVNKGRSNIRTLSPYEKRWIKIFAAGVSKKDIEQYVTSTGNYICNNNIAFTNHPFITAYSPHRKTILLLLSVMALVGLSPVIWLDRKWVVWRSEV